MKSNGRQIAEVVAAMPWWEVQFPDPCEREWFIIGLAAFLDDLSKRR